MASVWHSKPCARAHARQVAESRPPESSTTARSFTECARSHAAPGAPHPDVEPGAHPEAETLAGLGQHRRARAHRGIGETLGHEHHAGGRDAVLGDQPARVLEVRRVPDDDLEGGVRLAQPGVQAAPRIAPARRRRGQLGRQVVEQALVPARRGGDAAGFDLDPGPARHRLIEQLADVRVLERLAPGDDEERRLAEPAGALPDLIEGQLATARPIPGVLGVAPVAAHVAALEAHEVGRGAGRGTLSLEREEDLADAQGAGHRRGGLNHVAAQGAVNSVGRNSLTVSTSRVNTFTLSPRWAVGNHRPPCSSQPCQVYDLGGGLSLWSTMSHLSTRWFPRFTYTQ